MIITLCGSARFEPLFHGWMEALTLSGHAVFGLGAYPSWKDGDKDWYTPEQKAVLDEVHLAKIEASDAIVVLNHDAYIGESTLNEIEHARALWAKDRSTEPLRTRIFALESWGKGNGVGPTHNDEARARKARWGIPEDARSPIDTTRFGYAWLLMGTGPDRNAWIDRLTQLGYGPEGGA
jgi:hypothetical protein